MKIKVIEVITDTNIGGAGRLLLCRLGKMNRERFEETVIIPYGSALEENFKELGVRCLTMKCCFDRSFDIRGVFYLYKNFRRISPDIVNAHGCLSARIAAYLAKKDKLNVSEISYKQLEMTLNSIGGITNC